MATKKQLIQPNIPAALWVGSDQELLAKTITGLQQLFCPSHGCGLCITCTQIKTQQHHAIQWFMPEKWYTLEELKPITQTIAYALDASELYFFIIQKAHYLTAACANSLLKLIEEPPTGYHFILHTQQLDAILPTIRSRCVVENWYEEDQAYPEHELFNCFIQSTDPLVFFTKLEKSTINERESVELFNGIMNHWMAQYKKTFALPDATPLPIVSCLKSNALQLPMPGSAKLFWRNLFLQLQSLIQPEIKAPPL